MKTFQLQTEYATYNKVVCDKGEYENGNIAIVLVNVEEGEAIADLTVNLGPLMEGHAYLDTNNFPEARKFVEENGLGEPTGATAQSGFCIYPLYKLNLEAMGVK